MGTLDGGGLVGGADYEKLESARLLNSSEGTPVLSESTVGYLSYIIEFLTLFRDPGGGQC